MLSHLRLFAERDAGDDGVVRVPDEHEGGHAPIAGPHVAGGYVGMVGHLDRRRLRVLESSHGKAVCRSQIAFDADVRRVVDKEVTVSRATAEKWEEQSRSRSDAPLDAVAKCSRRFLFHVCKCLH
jgi:hypothetical protein